MESIVIFPNRAPPTLIHSPDDKIGVRERERTVLVNDDEAAIRNLLREVLQIGGFRVLTAGPIRKTESVWATETA